MCHFNSTSALGIVYYIMLHHFYSIEAYASYVHTASDDNDIYTLSGYLYILSIHDVVVGWRPVTTFNNEA